MADDPNPADDLLERARQLKARAGESSGEAPKDRDGTGPSQARPIEDAGWLVRTWEPVGRWLRKLGAIGAKIIRYTGPLRPVFGWIGSKLRGLILFMSCEKDKAGTRSLLEFSGKRLVRSLGYTFLIYVLILVLYVFGTRREGVFLISNYHLVNGESDVYQAGGCMKRSSTQSTCEQGEAEIVLIRPSWIPGMGLNPLDYDEQVGQIPIQGECYLGVYGWYLRGPALTRGLLKPVAYHVEKCRGIVPTAK